MRERSGSYLREEKASMLLASKGGSIAGSLVSSAVVNSPIHLREEGRLYESGEMLRCSREMNMEIFKQSR